MSVQKPGPAVTASPLGESESTSNRVPTSSVRSVSPDGSRDSASSAPTNGAISPSLEKAMPHDTHWSWFGLRRNDSPSSTEPLTCPLHGYGSTGNFWSRSSLRRYMPFVAALTCLCPDLETGGYRRESIKVIPTKADKMNWMETASVMCAETVSLGILSLPNAAAVMGVVPVLIVIGFMSTATYFSGLALWRIKLRHPGVSSYGDVGELMLGKKGRYFADANVYLLLIFIMAGHVNIFSTMANQIALAAGHSWQCTVAFKVLSLVLSTFITMRRKFKSSTGLTMISCVSIVAAAFTVMIGLIIASRGHPHPTFRWVVWASETNAAKILQGISMVVVSYTGSMAYFPIMHEMEEVKDFRKALRFTQAFTTLMYSAVAVIIYVFAGSGVPSPALGAASPVLAAVGYGLAAPTILIAGVITGVVDSKMVYNYSNHWLSFSKTELIKEKGKAVWWWRAVVLLQWIVAFIIANVLPEFGVLLSFIGSLVGPAICMGMPAAMKLWYDANEINDLLPPPYEKSPDRSKIGQYWVALRSTSTRYRAAYRHSRSPRTTAFCYFLLVLSVVLTIGGLYGSAVAIAKADWANALFKCTSNLEKPLV
ncbi:unnamed protein product [Zymoseptoria tritici ST99CH_3D1]|nr:unnamed protein product [Zymoseptoria tritici ST99CH_3D1]